MKANKWIVVLGLSVLVLSGCVRETVVISDSLITDADVYYEYYADNWGTSLEGEFLNDGETYIEAVQIEVLFYDRLGYLMDNEFVWVDTYFHPGESVGFYLDFPHRGVYDVVVRINRYD